jgi:two-component system response regulator
VRELSGYNIAVLKDGEKALEYIFATGEYSDRDASDLPKLIILDLKLPKITGLEVLRKIRSNERTKYVPVVILSSSNEESDHSESYALGIEDYVVKPNNYDDFKKAIQDIVMHWMQMNNPTAT